MLKRKQSKNNNEITAYGIGVVSSLLTILLLLCGSAICINNECLNIGDFKYMVILIQALGCCVGGIIAGAIGERNKKISVLVVSGVVVATQFVVGLLLLDGFPGGVLRLVIGASIASLVGYLHAVAKGKRTIDRHRKKTHR